LFHSFDSVKLNEFINNTNENALFNSSHHVDFIPNELEFDTAVCYFYSVLANQQGNAVFASDDICGGCENLLVAVRCLECKNLGKDRLKAHDICNCLGCINNIILLHEKIECKCSIGPVDKVISNWVECSESKDSDFVTLHSSSQGLYEQKTHGNVDALTDCNNYGFSVMPPPQGFLPFTGCSCK
jgi:hypothetical protein